MVLQADVPGERLALIRRGVPPHMGVRVFVTFFLLPFLLSPLAVLAAQVPREQLVFLLPFFLIWYGLIGLGIRAQGEALAYCSRLIWDGREQRLTVRMAGWFLWGRRTLAVPFAAVQTVRFEIGPEGKDPLSLTCHLRLQPEGRRERVLAVPFTIRDLNLREEAMDLAIRVGRILRWHGYLVRRSDPRQLDLELVRRVGLDSPAMDIPPVGRAARYDTDAEAVTFRKPDVQIPPFDPKRPVGRFEIVEWTPGRRVQIVRPPLPPAALGTAAGIGAVAGAITAVVLVGGWWPGMAALMVAGALATGIHVWYTERPREVVFDWPTGRALFRLGRTSRAVRFTDIEGLVLWGRTRRRSHGTRSTRTSYTVYWCELDAMLSGPDEVIAVSEETRDDPDVPYRVVLPMANELARALGVPWRWEDYPDV